MSLQDWDEVLRWLQENGAPAWCIRRREQELRDLERERIQLDRQFPKPPTDE